MYQSEPSSNQKNQHLNPHSNPYPYLYSHQQQLPQPNINNNGVIPMASNDRTYLLRQNYLINQNERVNHSYLSSPGRAIASCKDKSVFAHLDQS